MQRIPGLALVLSSLAGLCGLLGLFLPWFDPQLHRPINGIQNVNAAYHSWSGYRVLALGPLLLIIVAGLWIMAARGTLAGALRALADPVRALSLLALGAGLLAVAAALSALALMKYHYVDWDRAARAARAAGSDLDKNPQPGLWLVLVGGILSCAAGLLAVRAARPAVVAASGRTGSSR